MLSLYSMVNLIENMKNYSNKIRIFYGFLSKNAMEYCCGFDSQHEKFTIEAPKQYKPNNLTNILPFTTQYFGYTHRCSKCHYGYEIITIIYEKQYSRSVVFV